MLNHVLPSSSPGRSEVLALGPREKASRLARARSRNGSLLQKVVYLAGDVLAASHLDFERDDLSGCLRFHARPPWSLALQRIFKRWLDLVIIGRTVWRVVTAEGAY